MIAPTIPENESERLAAMYSLKLRKENKEDRFDKIVNLAARCLKMPIAYVASVDKDQQHIHASCGLNFVSSDRNTSFCGHAILQDEPLIIEDTHKDKRFFDNPLVLGEPHIRFYAGFPLKSPDGFKIGSLCVADSQTRKLDQEELETFIELGALLEQLLHLFQLGELQQDLLESKKNVLAVNKKLDKHNRFFQEVFGQYLSNDLLSSLLADEKYRQLGGEEVEATVLMSDLREFTPLCDGQEASVVVEVLNIYLGEMIEVIEAHGGFINEILGDGILVIFGAPQERAEHAFSAVMCAKAMHEGLKKVNRVLQEKGFPVLSMGIGINSGKLIAGNIGSKRRMKYGVIGDTVNLTSRIESFTVAGQTLISESTYEEVKDKVKPEGHLRVKIKGYSQVFQIYDVSTALVK